MNELIAKSVDHEQFRKMVCELAFRLGWKPYWTWRSIHSPSGFPDLVLAHEHKHRLIFAELKTKKYPTVSQDQKEWLHVLYCCTPEVYIWRYPEDWDEIEEKLK